MDVIDEPHPDRNVPTVDDPIFEIRDATVTFEMERGRSRVLDSVDFDVQRGEVIGVVGESGSGKSMFASALLDAVVEPGVLTGDITYYPDPDRPVDVLEMSEEQLRQFRWEDVSMVFQGAMSSFNPTKEIRAHFKETLKAHDGNVEEGMAHARDLLSDLYLEPERVLDAYPHELSGGMKQRTLIALSMLLEPDVLIMDEPTAALDLLMQRSIIQLIKEIKRKYDITIIFITHDLPLVAELADRLAVMYAFEFAEIGPTEEILESAGHPYTRALLNATPNIYAPIDEMQQIEGSSPDPVDVPNGCSYHPRCPLADDLCTEVDPHYYEMTDAHRARCHYWEDATESIPLQTTADASVGPSEGTRAAIAGSSSSETVVSLEDAEVHFEESTGFIDQLLDRSGDVVRAVDGVSLDIHENEVIALVGESGCGKTTLGKAAIGLEEVTGGSIRYRGQDIWEARRKQGDVEIPYEDIRRALQIIHQDPGSALNPNRTVMRSLSMPLERWNDDLDLADRHARILSMLETVGMTPAEDYANRYPHQLSGGEKQRVALIRALLMEPDLILADEAISALDVSLRIEMMELMLELQSVFDTAFLFISHDFSNARYIVEKAGGRIGVMYLGELVEIGTVDEIIHNPTHPYTKSLIWATPDLQTTKDAEELPIREIDIPDPKNPPSGCRFHTRCPEAREVCTRETPPAYTVDGSPIQRATCFRATDDHEYWQSEPITDTTQEPIDEPTRE